MSVPETCSSAPVPLHHRAGSAVSFARGRWPVYVGLGTGGVVRYGEDERHGRWWYHKTLWAVAPPYAGRVVISGFRIDGPQQLRFNTGQPMGGRRGRLRFESVPLYVGEDWRYGPSNTLIRAPGCYAFEVRGPEFIEYITFLARP